MLMVAGAAPGQTCVASMGLSMASYDDMRAHGIIQQHGSVIVRLGSVIDGALILVALCGALALLGIERGVRYLIIGIGAAYAFQIAATFSNLYRSWRVVRLRHELSEISVLWLATFCVTVVAINVVHILDISRTAGPHPGAFLAAWFLLALVAILGFRVAMRMFLRYYRAFGHDHRGVAIVGATQTARDLAATFRNNVWMGIDVVGIYAGDSSPRDDDPAWPAIRPLSELIDAARRREFDAVYVTQTTSGEDEIKELVDRFGDTTMPIYYCPPVHSAELLSGRWDDIGGHPVISLVESPFSGLDRHLKRLEDLVLVVLILPVTIIPMLAIAAAIKLTSRGPVFFRQIRYGLDGQEFLIWKFRTMTVAETDAEFRQAQRNDQRVTRLGAFLRKTSLDELPQLFNVIVGNMSVVGPRPHPVKLNEDHRSVIPRYMLRHIVKPGMTGWAQVNGLRGETETIDSMRARVEYDLQYIRNWSIWTDVRILFKTVHHVITRSNAY